tara:strand:- start:6192 stop:7469 length:1278 start_codon:yes stop_codon:yes gene_type:complete
MGAPQMGAPHMGQPGMGAPQMGQPGGDAISNLAARLPGSAPGTLFGIPLATLRDQALETKVLFIAGIALLVSVVIPLMHFSMGDQSKTIFVWTEGVAKFPNMIWPIIAAAVYLFVAKAPADLKSNIPPMVLKWAPFTVAFLGLGIGGWGVIYLMNMMSMGRSVPMGGALTMLNWGYPVLIFGLLSRLSNPNDAWARYVIGVGAGLCVAALFATIGDAFSFEGGALKIIHDLLFMLVLLVAVACAAFVPTPQQVPQLAKVDLLAPLATSVLLAWVPVQAFLLFIALVIEGPGFLTSLFILVHMLIATLAYFGIVMLTAPEAYDEAKRLMGGNGPQGNQQNWGNQMPQGGMPPQGGFPPQGGMPPQGGFPPQGGMPPQGGFPPQGGMPPQGGTPPQGGMPPQGGTPPQGGMPPQGGGGGFPPQGGQQ